MSVPPDIEALLSERLKDVLEASAPWRETFKSGNRIWTHKLATSGTPDKPNYGDSDYPQSRLESVSGTNDMFDTEPTFATHADEYDTAQDHWQEAATWVFRLALTSALLTERQHTPLNQLTTAALRRAGPRLGHAGLLSADGGPLPPLPGVVGWKFRWESTRTDQVSAAVADRDDDSDAEFRLKTTYTITIETRYDGHDQTGD